jgi:hypothetical protein
VRKILDSITGTGELPCLRGGLLPYPFIVKRGSGGSRGYQEIDGVVASIEKMQNEQDLLQATA